MSKKKKICKSKSFIFSSFLFVSNFSSVFLFLHLFGVCWFIWFLFIPSFFAIPFFDFIPAVLHFFTSLLLLKLFHFFAHISSLYFQFFSLFFLSSAYPFSRAQLSFSLSFIYCYLFSRPRSIYQSIYVLSETLSVFVNVSRNQEITPLFTKSTLFLAFPSSLTPSFSLSLSLSLYLSIYLCIYLSLTHTHTYTHFLMYPLFILVYIYIYIYISFCKLPFHFSFPFHRLLFRLSIFRAQSGMRFFSLSHRCDHE